MVLSIPDGRMSRLPGVAIQFHLSKAGSATDMGDNRQIGRDSLFLMAELRLEGADDVHRVKVRNLSASGMMGEGPVRVVSGDRLTINIRNIGWVDGTVAWIQDNRFGVAFRDEIDPKLARAPVGSGGEHTPRHLRPVLPTEERMRVLRKI